MEVERPALLASSHWGRWQASHCSSSWSALRVQGAQGRKAATVSLPRSDLLVQTIRNTQQIYSSAKENKFVLSQYQRWYACISSQHFLTWGISLEEKLEQKHGIWAPPGTTIPQRQREWPGLGAGRPTAKDEQDPANGDFLPAPGWEVACARFLGPEDQPTHCQSKWHFRQHSLKSFLPLSLINFQKFLSLLHRLGKKYWQSTELKNFLGNTKEWGAEWKVFLFFRNKINNKLLKINK